MLNSIFCRLVSFFLREEIVEAVYIKKKTSIVVSSTMFVPNWYDDSVVDPHWVCHLVAEPPYTVGGESTYLIELVQERAFHSNGSTLEFYPRVMEVIGSLGQYQKEDEVSDLVLLWAVRSARKLNLGSEEILEALAYPGLLEPNVDEGMPRLVKSVKFYHSIWWLSNHVGLEKVN